MADLFWLCAAGVILYGVEKRNLRFWLMWD